WPEMEPRLKICDAVNLHYFSDRSFDAIHSAQAAEHWRPELVPHILAELARVTATSGVFFCALDTTELFARENLQLETEDPTPICIKPLGWWHEALEKNRMGLMQQRIPGRAAQPR